MLDQIIIRSEVELTFAGNLAPILAYLVWRLIPGFHQYAGHNAHNIRTSPTRCFPDHPDYMLILDGGLGTELETRLAKDDPRNPLGNPLWLGQVLLLSPDLIELIHREYVDAGAEVLVTATYQLLYDTLIKHKNYTLDEAHNLWNEAIQVAKRASKPGVMVAGLVGPYATYLADGSEYTGEYNGATVSELREYHEPLVKYLNNHPDVDMVAFETIPNRTELEAVVQVAETLNKKFYVLMNLTLKGLVNGTDIDDVIRLLEPLRGLLNFLAVGINCCDYKQIETLAQLMPFPLYVYPNLGYEYDQTKGFYGVVKDDDAWRAAVEAWSKLPNVEAMGGCCSTGPHEIAIVKEIVSKE